MEKEQVRRLIDTKAQPIVQELESRLGLLIGKDIEKKAESLRVTYGRKIAAALCGIGGEEDVDFKRDFLGADPDVRQKMADAIRDILIERHSVLRGLLELNSTHIINEIAEDDGGAGQGEINSTSDLVQKDAKENTTKVDVDATSIIESLEQIKSFFEKSIFENSSVSQILGPTISLLNEEIQRLKNESSKSRGGVSENLNLIEEARKKRVGAKVDKALAFLSNQGAYLDMLMDLDLSALTDELLSEIIEQLLKFEQYLRNSYPDSNINIPSVRSGAPLKVSLDPEKLEDDPDHPERIPFRNTYLKKFCTFVDAGRSKDGFEYLMNQADKAITEFIGSGSGQGASMFGSQYMGMFDALKDFNPDRDSHAKSRVTHKDWGSKTDPSLENREYAKKLYNKAVEMITFSYIKECSIRHAHAGSLVSDWGAIKEFYKKESEENFNMGAFDFFLLGSKDELDKDVEGGGKVADGKYKYSKIFTYFMWDFPRLIREVEKEVGIAWNDGDTNKHSKVLKSKIKERLGEIIKERGSVVKVVPQHKSKDAQGRVTARWANGANENGDRKFEFRPEDLEGLTGITGPEFDHLVDYIMTMGATLGVRQHTFTEDLARGQTPGGYVSTFKEWMVKTMRLPLMNYNCYKGVTVHPGVSIFRFTWSGAPDGDSNLKKKENIVKSVSASLKLLDRITRVRSERVYVGDLSESAENEFPIELTYPNLYSFIIRAYDRRQGKSATIPTFVDGLNAVDDFVTQALIVPGKEDNPEKIKAIDKSVLIDMMADDLRVLIHTKVSPLKTNTEWINWRHIAQYIVAFIDRMYLIYNIKDNTAEGRMALTNRIRNVLELHSDNLFGVAKKEEWIINDSGSPEKPDQTGKKPTPKAKEFLTTTEFHGLNDAQMSSDYGVYEVKNQQDGTNIPPDIRDWILSRIPEVVGPKPLGHQFMPLSMLVGQNAGTPEDMGRKSIGRAAGPARTMFESNIKGLINLQNIMHNGFGVVQNAIDDFRNKPNYPKFVPDFKHLVFGTPAESQKKTPDDEKK